METTSNENRWEKKEARIEKSFLGKRGSLTISRNLFRGIDHRLTPYFQFSLPKIRENIKALASMIQPDSLFYAVKCNSLTRILRTVDSAGCGFEINNKNEWKILDRLGLSNRSLINSSPISSAGDVRFLHARGVQTFCFDSREQVDNLCINAPGVDAYVRLYHGNTGSRFKLNRFGADFAMAMDLIAYAQKKGLNPVGVTFHVGSQCCDAGSWEEAIKKASRLFIAFPFLRILNIGGGFPVMYLKKIPSLKQLGETIHDSLDKYFQRRPEIYVEPGRFIVGDAAFTCASVIQVREEKPVSRAVIDMSVFSGFMEILEISDGFHYPISGEARASGELVRYHLGGPSCAGTDMICRDIMLPRLHVDYRYPHLSSRIYFANTGAYTLDYIARHQKTGFNGSRIPKIFFSGEEENHGMAI